MMHFTAVIDINKTEDKTTTESGNRHVKEVARIVVRADSLEKLVEKAGKHLELVEEN